MVNKKPKTVILTKLVVLKEGTLIKIGEGHTIMILDELTKVRHYIGDEQGNPLEPNFYTMVHDEESHLTIQSELIH